MRFFSRCLCDRKQELGMAWAELHEMQGSTGVSLFISAYNSYLMIGGLIVKFLLVSPSHSLCDSRYQEKATQTLRVKRGRTDNLWL